MKITSATEAQWEAIESLRLRWLNEEQTAQYPVHEIRETCYRTLPALKGRMIWVVDSPIIARIIANLDANLDANLHANLYDNLYANLYANLHDNLDANLYANLYANLQDNLYANLHANLRANLQDNLHANLYANLRDNLDANLDANLYANLHANLRANLQDNLHANLYANLRANLQDNLYANLDANLDDSISNIRYYCGVWWNVRCAWFEGGRILGAPEVDQMELFSRFNRHCPVWMWSERDIFILRRPREIHWRQDDVAGLHNEFGPAVYYSPLWSLWAINGVSVDRQIVMDPETQTVEQIRSEQNEEVKRIRIDRYGWTRYLTEIRAKRIDSRRNDIEGTREYLYRGDGICTLLCACPSTGKTFALEVPPDVETCEQAQGFLSSGLSGRIISAS